MIDLTKLHDLEQKVLALMTFITTHADQLQKARADIADLFKQISALKAEAVNKQ